MILILKNLFYSYTRSTCNSAHEDLFLAQAASSIIMYEKWLSSKLSSTPRALVMKPVVIRVDTTTLNW